MNKHAEKIRKEITGYFIDNREKARSRNILDVSYWEGYVEGIADGMEAIISLLCEVFNGIK